MNTEFVFIFITISFGAWAADWMNVTKSRIQICYDLPNEITLPRLGFLDRMLRKEAEELSVWFVIPFILLPLLGWSVVHWRYFFFTPAIFFIGYLAASLLLPNPFSKFYSTRTVRAIKKSVIDSHQCDTLVKWIEQIASGWKSESGKQRLKITWSGPLTSAERYAAFKLNVYFVFNSNRLLSRSEAASSSLYAVCHTHNEAEKLANTKPFSNNKNGNDYEIRGPSNLLHEFVSGLVSAEQVRQLLRGESPVIAA